MTDLEIRKKKLDLSKLATVKLELEYRTYELLAEIERLKVMMDKHTENENIIKEQLGGS